MAVPSDVGNFTKRFVVHFTRQKEPSPLRPRVVFSILCGIAAALTFILFSPSTLTGGNPGGGVAPFLQIPQDTSRARAVTTRADSSKAGLPGAQD